MRWVVVDGIYGSNNREFGFNFYSIKPDYWEIEEKYEDDGYLDEENVYWESPYAPISLARGEIDMETWMSEGIIRGMRDDFIF